MFEGSLPNVQGLLQTTKDEYSLWCMHLSLGFFFFSILVNIFSFLGVRVLGPFECICVFFYFGWVSFPSPLYSCSFYLNEMTTQLSCVVREKKI